MCLPYLSIKAKDDRRVIKRPARYPDEPDYKRLYTVKEKRARSFDSFSSGSSRNRGYYLDAPPMMVPDMRALPPPPGMMGGPHPQMPMNANMMPPPQFMPQAQPFEPVPYHGSGHVYDEDDDDDDDSSIINVDPRFHGNFPPQHRQHQQQFLPEQMGPRAGLPPGMGQPRFQNRQPMVGAQSQIPMNINRQGMGDPGMFHGGGQRFGGPQSRQMGGGPQVFGGGPPEFQHMGGPR
ncbi:MAG: hypothetical protein M1824_005789 [Vezdaea acicularis]|nr:MAG: hypothetical protein M1824_005789 [Vezdaea acicularis]